MISSVGGPHLLEMIPSDWLVCVMAESYVAYFDESYRTTGLVDNDGTINPKTFCIAGYLLTAEAAKEMDRAWQGVLDRHGIEYFHMVDCNSQPPDGPCLGQSEEETLETFKELVGLIHSYTIEGFAVMATEGLHDGFDDEHGLYTDFADSSVAAFLLFLKTGRLEGSVQFIFEQGHKSEDRAYTQIADKWAGIADGIAFQPKRRFRLLQAADILAWQTRKYVQDRTTGGVPPEGTS